MPAILPAQTITTFAGGGVADGVAATNAPLDEPFGVFVDAAGNIYVADTAHNRVRKIDTSGIITTIAGTGTSGFSGDGGPAANARIYSPEGQAAPPTSRIAIGAQCVGIAQAAYDFTLAYLRGEIEGIPVKRRMYPTKQISVADMFVKLQCARAIFGQVFAEARLDPSKDDRLRAYAAQYTVMETANEICRLAIRTCGGQSMLKSLPLERHYRDSRLGSLMLPWTAELCLDRLGRETLYEPGEDDD